MAANNFLFDADSAKIFNEVVAQATGRTDLAAVDETSFVSIATTLLQQGVDTIYNALQQVLSRTLFSIRPYEAQFASIQVDNEMYGNHIRKINYIYGKYMNDTDRFNLKTGDAIDPWVVTNQEVVQTNFYGQIPGKVRRTFYVDQLNVAFSSSAEFGRFVAGIMTSISNEIELKREAERRLVVNNFIAGKYASDPGNVIHLLTEYNADTGEALTDANVFNSDNFANFTRWMYARIETLSKMLRSDSVLYHKNITGKEINRHTPEGYQKMIMLSDFYSKIKSTVLSTTFHEKFLRMNSFEEINYWQSIKSPDSIMVTPNYMADDGTIVTAEEAVAANKIVGVIFDYETMGITNVNERVVSTPVNADGVYYNTVWHWNSRYWNDFTENGIVLALN